MRGLWDGDGSAHLRRFGAAPITIQYDIDNGGSATPDWGIGGTVTGGTATFTCPIPSSAGTCSTYTPPSITTGLFPVPGGPPVNNCGPIAFNVQLIGTGGSHTITGVLGSQQYAKLTTGGVFLANYKLPPAGTYGAHADGYSGLALGTGASNPSDGIGQLQFTWNRLDIFVGTDGSTFTGPIGSYGIQVTGQEVAAVPEPGTAALLMPALMLVSVPLLRRLARKSA